MSTFVIILYVKAYQSSILFLVFITLFIFLGCELGSGAGGEQAPGHSLSCIIPLPPNYNKSFLFLHLSILSFLNPQGFIFVCAKQILFRVCLDFLDNLIWLKMTSCDIYCRNIKNIKLMHFSQNLNNIFTKGVHFRAWMKFFLQDLLKLK